MSIPFHKQTNASKLAGQIVYPLPESANKQAGQVVFQDYKQETTLAQYIERKTDAPRKITFDEWIENNEDASAESIWYAALRYGKIS